jgi:chromosome segregation ATPase
METTEKKETEKTENQKTESKTETKKPDTSWWEGIAKDNPQLGSILKTLSNPLISAGSIAGLFYLLHTKNVDKEKAKQFEEEIIKKNEEAIAEFDNLKEEYAKLKKKYKKLKRLISGEGKISPAFASLNGVETPKNPLYKTSFLD